MSESVDIVAMAPSTELLTNLVEESAAQSRKNCMGSHSRGAAIALFFLIALALFALPGFSLTRWNDAFDVNGTRSVHLQLGEDSPVCEADNGVVASDDGRCSIAGRNVLSRGGHAIDAAVATTLCEGVVNPMSSGIGGGGFLLLRLSNGSTFAYDFREVAPAASTKDMYADNPNSKNEGALSAGVPGEIAGLYLAWQHHGRLPWKALFEPAINFARYGFVVTPYLELGIAGSLSRIMAHKALRQLLLPDGRIVKAGDILYNLELADTLQLISEQGPAVLYSGVVGHRLVADLNKEGGIMTVDDLKNYKVEVRKAVVTETLGYTILGMPPPSSGGASLALIFGILSNFADFSSASEELQYHRLVEAFKHAYAVRMNLGDPAFNDFSNVLKDMLSPEFALKLQKRIVDNATFPPQYYGSSWNQLVDQGTCHFAVVDSDRNALALTTTVNWHFGSKVLSSSTGILLNNEMDDFSSPTDPLAPQVNFVAPNKRPLSSMSPTIILEKGQLRGVLGASGGTKIITGVAQVFLNYFVKGLEPLAAVSTPRVHHQLLPNEVDCEKWTTASGEELRVEERIRAGLSERGHKVVETTGFCVTQLIVHDLNSPAPNHHWNNSTGVFYGRLIGVSDVRKEGSPAGY